MGLRRKISKLSKNVFLFSSFCAFVVWDIPICRVAKKREREERKKFVSTLGTFIQLGSYPYCIADLARKVGILFDE